jgi:hypothetical protein
VVISPVVFTDWLSITPAIGLASRPAAPPPKKRNAEPRQNSKYRQSVIDPLVNLGSPPHRHQARPKADPTRTYHCMVALGGINSENERHATAVADLTKKSSLFEVP